MTEKFGTGEKGWAATSHLATFSGLLIPFGHLLGPLVVGLLKRKTMPFVAEQAKEAMNFQISIMIYAAAAVLLIWVWIGWILLALVVAADFVFVIAAASRSYRGVHYRYPLTLRMIR